MLSEDCITSTVIGGVAGGVAGAAYKSLNDVMREEPVVPKVQEVIITKRSPGMRINVPKATERLPNPFLK
jgi:hypothetical protein